MSGNNASTNDNTGILVFYSSNSNKLNGNNVSNNKYGIDLHASSNSNTVSGNIISSNSINGIYLSGSSNNIYNNYFNNTINLVINTGSNTWNKAKTSGKNIIGGPYLGGNFWAYPNGTGFSQKCGDVDQDGICDSSYELNSENVDNLPLTMMTQNFPPVADCGADKLECENVASPVSFNASGSYDPDGAIVSYYWDFGDGTNSTNVAPVLGKNPTHPVMLWEDS